MFSMRERGWLALDEVTVISGAHSDGEVGSDAHKILSGSEVLVIVH